MYPSSSAAYPVRLQQRHLHKALAERDIDWAAPELPDAAYGWVKLYGEQMAMRAKNHGANIHIIRPMSGYGTDQDITYPFGAFLARTTQQADPFQVWGDGSQVRDWVHVDDIMRTIEAMIDADYQSPLNIGTGIPTSFASLAELFTVSAGYAPTIEYLPDKPTGVHSRYADTTRLHALYTPRVSLSEGVRRALAGS